jgi:hypothetical protein
MTKIKTPATAISNGSAEAAAIVDGESPDITRAVFEG